jgi:integrase
MEIPMKRSTQGYGIYKDKEGKLVLTYDTGAGRDNWKKHRIPKHVAVEENAAAHKYARTFLARLSPRETKQKTIRERFPEWIAIRMGRTSSDWKDESSKLTPQTVADNESQMMNHILDDRTVDPTKPVFGDMIPDELTAPLLRAWVRRLRAGKAPNTVGNIVSTLTSFMDDAIGEEWTKNPFNIVRSEAVRAEMPKRVRRSGTVVVTAPMEAIQKLILCQDVDVMRRVKDTIAFCGGLRDGELCGMQFLHVHETKPIPYYEVRQQFAAKAKKGEGKALTKAAITGPKTAASKRKVPAHPASCAAFAWWKKVGWKAYFGREPTPLDPLFPGVRTGTFARPKSAEAIRKDLKKAECSDMHEGFPITFHATRRSFLSWLAELEVSKELRDWLVGHTADDTLDDKYIERQLPRMYEAVCRIPIVWPKDPVGTSWQGGGDKRRWQPRWQHDQRLPRKEHVTSVEVPKITH